MKNLGLCAAVAAVIASGWIQEARAEGSPSTSLCAESSFFESCRHTTLKGAQLSAECQPADFYKNPVWHSTSIDISTCARPETYSCHYQGDDRSSATWVRVDNINGNLKCAPTPAAK